MIDELQKHFNDVKSIDWSKALVSFYVVKRKLVNRKATYQILFVNTDEKLRKRMRKVSSQKIINSNQALEYDYHTIDLDDNLLGISTDETDLKEIIDNINAGNYTEVTDVNDLLGSWMYISRLEVDGKVLYSVRKIVEGWDTKKKWEPINLIFSDNMLVDIDEKNVFRVDNKIDFFSFDGVIFIADKKVFEAALNFREGMERNRDEIVEEFKQQNLFVDADEISRLVGNNMHRLRKLSQVKKSEYYKDQVFLTNLKIVSKQEKWGIEYSDDGKLMVDENSIDTILTVLNNSRLKSPINQESFDVDSKHKL
ncbi:MAG: DUF4868 domain-containing protein [Pasteurella sp.]|nr:DUF4868 domain-containing protein [Pasteurella sp.]